MRAELEPLGRSYDVVVANPPYMGSSSLGKWVSAWVKKHYAEAYRDLCTSFIDRGFTLSRACGYSAMVTMQSWMFLGSFERLREKILRDHSISSMAHLGTRAFGQIAGEVVSTTATVFANAKSEVKGAYFHLVDMGSEAEKREGLLEALANADCGWFYRRDADAFRQIPGSPIAYWASDAMLNAFKNDNQFRALSAPKQGLATANNNRFLRMWWEVSDSRSNVAASSNGDGTRKWVPMTKGGEFRRWFGNLEYVVNWDNDGHEIKSFVVDGKLKSRPQNVDSYFKPGLTWTAISSGLFCMREMPPGLIPNAKGPVCVETDISKRLVYLALVNSSSFMRLLTILAPTLDYSQGPVGAVPVPSKELSEQGVSILGFSNQCVSASKSDWDSLETSWNFKHSPLT